MRRVFLLVSLAAVAIAAIAASASAQTATKFSVVAVNKSSQRSGHSIIVRQRLLQPGNLSNQVGHATVKITPRHRRVRIRGVGVFRGEGSLKVRGTEGPGDNRLPIIGGTGEFNGAAGKL